MKTNSYIIVFVLQLLFFSGSNSCFASTITTFTTSFGTHQNTVVNGDSHSEGFDTMADCTAAGHISLQAQQFGWDYPFSAGATFSQKITNSSNTEQAYYLPLSYNISLILGFPNTFDYEGLPSANASISVKVDNALLWDINYKRMATITQLPDLSWIVNDDGPRSIAETKSLYLGTLNPNQSLDLTYSMIVSVACDEHFSAFASGDLADDIRSTPVPEPSGILLVGTGFPGVVLLLKKWKRNKFLHTANITRKA